MVTTLDDTETFELPTGIDSNVVSSVVFLIIMLPLSASTASLKVRTILAVSETPVAPSAGVAEAKVGTVASLVVKLSVVFDTIPA